MSSSLGNVASLGVGSGLPLGNLVTQLVATDGAPETAQIASQQSKDTTESTALTTLQNNLSSFQSAIESNVTNTSIFTSKTGASSDNSVVTVTPTSATPVGNHSIVVSNLASTQSLVSSQTTPFASASSVVGTGTLSFEFGTTALNGTFTQNAGSAAQAVTIDSSNDTLQGIANAINSANIGVNASLVNNGSGYLLELTSASTGAANSMKIIVSNNDGDGGSDDTSDTGLAQLAYDPAASAGSGKNLSQTAIAADASVQFDGINITSASNTLTNVLAGASITLLQGGQTQAQTLTISSNSDSAIANVQAFITSFNSNYNSIMEQLASYDATTQVAGPLFSDGDVSTLDAQVRGVLDSQVPGLTGPYESLADLGITLDNDGSLSLDTSQLDAALSANPTAVAAVFGPSGDAISSYVQYDSSSATTNAGSYDVNITQPATNGNIVGSDAAETTITTGVNDLLDVDVNGNTSTVTLAAGTYTASSLATMVQDAINNNSTFQSDGASVNVTQNSGILTITSTSYGAGSQIQVTGGDGATDLLGGAPVATTGLDVAGTIGGEAATGQGQVLTGNGADTQGLVLTVTGTTAGDYGELNYSQGVGLQLSSLLSNSLGSSGFIATRLSELATDQTQLSQQQTDLNAQLVDYQNMLIAQYSALDTFVASEKNTLAYLQAQLGSSTNSTGGTNVGLSADDGLNSALGYAVGASTSSSSG